MTCGDIQEVPYLSILPTYVCIFDSHSFREDGQEIDLSAAASLLVVGTSCHRRASGATLPFQRTVSDLCRIFENSSLMG